MKIQDYTQKRISIEALVKLIREELEEFKLELNVGNDIKSRVSDSLDKKFVKTVMDDFDNLFVQFSDLYSLCLKIKHSSERTLNEEKWRVAMATKKKVAVGITPVSVEAFLAGLSPEVKAQMKARVESIYSSENTVSENPVEKSDLDPKP